MHPEIGTYGKLGEGSETQQAHNNNDNNRWIYETFEGL